MDLFCSMLTVVGGALFAELFVLQEVTLRRAMKLLFASANYGFGCRLKHKLNVVAISECLMQGKFCVDTQLLILRN